MKTLSPFYGNVALQYIRNRSLSSYAPQWISGGIVFVWKTATVTFPGGFTDGGKTAKQKDLKTYYNRSYLYAKETQIYRAQILPMNLSDFVFPLTFLGCFLMTVDGLSLELIFHCFPPHRLCRVSCSKLFPNHQSATAL